MKKYCNALLAIILTVLSTGLIAMDQELGSSPEADLRSSFESTRVSVTNKTVTPEEMQRAKEEADKVRKPSLIDKFVKEKRGEEQKLINAQKKAEQKKRTKEIKEAEARGRERENALLTTMWQIPYINKRLFFMRVMPLLANLFMEQEEDELPMPGAKVKVKPRKVKKMNPNLINDIIRAFIECIKFNKIPLIGIDKFGDRDAATFDDLSVAHVFNQDELRQCLAECIIDLKNTFMKMAQQAQPFEEDDSDDELERFGAKAANSVNYVDILNAHSDLFLNKIKVHYRKIKECIDPKLVKKLEKHCGGPIELNETFTRFLSKFETALDSAGGEFKLVFAEVPFIGNYLDIYFEEINVNKIISLIRLRRMLAPYEDKRELFNAAFAFLRERPQGSHKDSDVISWLSKTVEIKDFGYENFALFAIAARCENWHQLMSIDFIIDRAIDCIKFAPFLAEDGELRYREEGCRVLLKLLFEMHSNSEYHASFATNKLLTILGKDSLRQKEKLEKPAKAKILKNSIPNDNNDNNKRSSESEEAEL